MIVAVGFFVIVLPTLNILLCREWVKRNLLERCCAPLQIRWNLFDFGWRATFCVWTSC